MGLRARAKSGVWGQKFRQQPAVVAGQARRVAQQALQHRLHRVGLPACGAGTQPPVVQRQALALCVLPGGGCGPLPGALPACAQRGQGEVLGFGVEVTTHHCAVGLCQGLQVPLQ